MMVLRILLGVLVFLGICPDPSRAEAPTAAWYVGASAGVMVTDSGFQVDGHFSTLRVGKHWGKQYAWEVELLRDELDFGEDYDLRHTSIGLNHRTINHEPMWKPYILVGVAIDRFESPVGIREGTDFAVNIGFGGEWELKAPQKVMLRLDARLRYDFNDTRQPGQIGFGDGVIGLGLTVPFQASSDGS